MNASYKPDDYSTVSPYLVVSGAAGTLDFLRLVFDAEELRRFTNADGTIMHAEVRVGDSVIMLGDRQSDWTPMPAYVHIYVPDVDDTYRRALTAGATAIQEPIKKDDPDRRAGVMDAGGTTWWIATKVD